MMEMDALFVCGLRLLHSKSKDSAEQLRQLLDDVIAKKCTGVNPREVTNKLISVKQEPELRLTSGSVTKKHSPKHIADIKQEDNRRKDTEKRSFDKLKQDLVDFSSDSKRSRVNSPYSSLSSSPSPQPIRSSEDVGSKDVSEDSDDTEDAEDFAMKMGLACIVCRQLEVLPKNQLIECQECHNLYHQECHRPPVTDSDINDPRHVWYCARCMKNMKKVVSKSQKVTKPSPVLSTKDFTASTTKVVPKPEPALSSLLPFKRTEIKSSVSQSGFSGNNKPTGLANLAASLSSSSSSRSLSTSSGGKGLSVLAKNPVPSSPKTTSAFSSLSTLSSSSSSSHSSPSKPSPPQGGLPKPMGMSVLASAAATMAKSSSSGGSGNGKSGLSLLSSSSTSGRNAPPGNGSNGGAKASATSSLMSADKRLQIMKKKAAAKMQEKRRLSSK